MNWIYKIMKLMVAVMVMLVAAVACTSESSVSRQDVLVSLTDGVIVPTFHSAARNMNALRDDVRELCARPSPASLKQAQESWRDAKQTWMRSRAMGFGPAMDRRSRSFVDWWPVEPERIEKTLASRDSVDTEYVREFLSTTQRGLGAIEYVLFEGDDVLTSLSDSDQPRCEYVVAAAEVAADEMNGLIGDWVGAGGEMGGYVGEFTGRASSALLPLAAVSETVRTTIFLLRSIADMQLGAGLGMNDGEADPMAIRSGPARSGVSDLREQVLGMQDTYLGAVDSDPEALGIGSLVRGVSEDADERVRESFRSAIAAIDTLEEPLHDTIYSNRENAVEVYEALKELQRTLNTEVVSLLGITVGFADTDGDGG